MLNSRLNLRNIGIISHINAGKTTTTERILYYAGKTNISGDVDKGTTVTDYLIQERNRGITITSAAVSYNWLNHRVNLIDTPGHVDFTIEVERSVSVIDGAVTILDASSGVEAQTRTVWNQAAKYKLPNIIYLNKYDKPAADYKTCLSDLKLCLAINPALLQLPVIDKDGKFNMLIDVVNRICITHSTNFKSDVPQKPVLNLLVNEHKLDKKYIYECEEFRENLINQLSDLDDLFASHVMDCSKIEQVDAQKIEDALRNATVKQSLCPVLIGSSFKHVGVQSLMDAIVKYLPSPIDREEQMSSIFGKCNESSGAFCGFIFKILHNKHHGALTYIKICNGFLNKHQKQLVNIASGKTEYVKKVFEPFADELVELDRKASRDDIIILTGLQESKTGEILVDDVKLRNAKRARVSDELPFSRLNGILVPDIEPMDSVYYCSIESPSSSQQLKFEHALQCMAREDPSFSYEIDELGSTTIRGMGKLHLEIIRDRIESEFGVCATLGALQIAYRETINSGSTQEFVIDKVINGVKNSMRIVLQVKPSTGSGSWKGKKLKINQNTDSEMGNLRSDYQKAIENGIFTSLHCGPKLGFPVVDCEVKLMEFDANFKCTYPVISSGASQCVLLALRNSEPIVLEPMMSVEIITPIEKNGLILGDISSRRGKVLSTCASENGTILIKSQIPLSELRNYSEFIRTTTSGRGSFSLNLLGYVKMSTASEASIVRC